MEGTPFVEGLMFGMGTAFMFGISGELPGTPITEGGVIEPLCRAERPRLTSGILGMGGLAVPGEGRDVGGGDGLDAHDGLPDVAMGSPSGRLLRSS